MKMIRQRKYLFALLAILLVFAGCKGESPTAPAPTPGPGGGVGGGTGGGGGTPPLGANVTLSVSNVDPLVGSSSIVTATVTIDGQPAPNGTAVEFSTNFGTFTGLPGGATTAVIRTTTNGVATVTLTSGTPGIATIQAVVNNVIRTAQVTFREQPVVQPPPDTTPAITAVSPAFGRPAGGEQIVITGRNFRAPARVLFDFGGGVTREAFVVSVTPTQIVVIAPPIEVTQQQQQRPANIIVIVDAGTSAEQRVTAPTPFTYQLETLQPVVFAVSPDAGPTSGGTRITIFGEGFQAPVQVSFGDIPGNVWAQAQVLNVTYNQITVVTPAARDITPAGNAALTGPVDLRIININSNSRVEVDNAFRFTPGMQITAIRPLLGPSIGGTDITIDGIGFNDPVQVTVAGVAAQVLRVSGTQILVRTGNLPGCESQTGAVVVRNIENGDTATAPTPFQYIAVSPTITAISTSDPTPQPGENVTITVSDVGVGALGSAVVRVSINGTTVLTTPGTVTTGTGTQQFTGTIPANITFPTEQCSPAPGQTGVRFAPLTVQIGFTNQTTGCSDVLEGGLRIFPPEPNPCVVPPPVATQTAPAAGQCANAGSAAVAGGTGSTTITFRNGAVAGGQTLTVTPPAGVGGANPSDFGLFPTTAQSATPGSTVSFTVNFDPSAAGTRNGQVTFTTNDPANPSITVCLTGTGT